MSNPQPSDWSDPTQPASPVPPSAFGHPSEPTTAPAHPYTGTYPTSGYGYGYGYGQPVYVQPVIVTAPTNGMAIAALVCAVLGLGPVAAILGHVARKQIRETGEQGDGMALAGVIVGWITTGIYACVCAGYILFFATILGTVGTVGT
jgi:hypothetical protein